MWVLWWRTEATLAESWRDEADRQRGNLRQLLLSLDRAQLCVVHGWILQQLSLPPSRLILVRLPDQGDFVRFDGDFVELAAKVRQHISRLPEAELAVLRVHVLGLLDRS